MHRHHHQKEGIEGLPLQKKAVRKVVVKKGAAKSMEKKPAQSAAPKMTDIYAVKIECDSTKPTTKIQIVFIGGKKETVTVNMTTTISALYSHVTALSGSFYSF